MEIVIFRKHAVVECEFCGDLLVAPAMLDFSPLVEKYRQHVLANESCEAFHAALPNLFDVKERWRTPLRSIIT